MALFLMMGWAAQAQVIFTATGDTLRFDKEDPLQKIEPLHNSFSDIQFITTQGDTLLFDVGEIDYIVFAGDVVALDQIKAEGKLAIVYDPSNEEVIVMGASQEEEGIIRVFDVEAKLLKQAKGTSINVAELPDGLYIVNYNKVLNAKIVKK